MANNQSTFTQEHSDLLRTTIDAYMLNMYFCLPGKIVLYDPETQYADIEIQLYMQFIDSTLGKYPVIPNVPVKHPRAQGGACFIHMPLAVGDDVVLVFSQRSLDNWKTYGGINNPNDPRKCHITDAYALIGGSALPDAFMVQDPTAIEITNESSTLQVFPDGKFAIKNGTTELLAQIQEGFQTLSEDTTNTLLGPMPLNSFETYAQIASKIQTLVKD